jgi:hypothetical protein
MSKTLAEKWAQRFRQEGGQWPEDGHWPDLRYAIEQEMNAAGDVAHCGGGGYENENNQGGDLGTPYIFVDNSGFLLSGGDDKEFPAVRLFSAVEIADLQSIWDRAADIVIHEPNEIRWLEKHVAEAEGSPKRSSDEERDDPADE